MIRRAMSRLHIIRVSRPSLTKKTVATHLRSAATIHSSAQCSINGIGDDVLHSEANCSSFEERRDILTSLDDHDDTAIDSMSFTSLDDDESDKVGKRKHGQCAKALGPIYDSDCRNVSFRSDTTCNYGPESQMEKGREQAKGFSSSTKTGVTTAAALLRLTPAPVQRAVAKYRCATETYGCTEVRVGKGDYIPRWRKGSELTYTVDTESFPTLDEAMQVKAAMQKAIRMWRGIGVSFKYLKVDCVKVHCNKVDCDNKATFVVRYDNRRRSNTYASSFFPDESPGDLLVYKRGLSNAAYLANILAHEIGHILGLRHEFADKKHKEGRILRCVLYGKKNPRSVMNYYKHPRRLQVGKQDLKELKKFYAHDEAKYKGLPIYDYDPITHKRIPRKKTRSSRTLRQSGRRPSRCRTLVK
ncbi:hypothetical protein GGI35DRAFT_459125 [Trichoderma velutinum]